MISKITYSRAWLVSRFTWLKNSWKRNWVLRYYRHIIVAELLRSSFFGYLTSTVFLPEIAEIWIGCLTLTGDNRFLVLKNSPNVLSFVLILNLNMNIGLASCSLSIGNDRVLPFNAFAFFFGSDPRLILRIKSDSVTRLIYNWFHLNRLHFWFFTFFVHWNWIISLFIVAIRLNIDSI